MVEIATGSHEGPCHWFSISCVVCLYWQTFYFIVDVISWRQDISTDEELSGVAAMDTGAGMKDWTKEPEPESPGSSSSNWADFGSTFGNNPGDHTHEYVLMIVLKTLAQIQTHTCMCTHTHTHTHTQYLL